MRLTSYFSSTNISRMETLNGLLTAAQIATRLRLTATRVNQIAKDMKLKPVAVVGCSHLYSSEQVEKIRKRNKKPGPSPKKGGLRTARKSTPAERRGRR